MIPSRLFLCGPTASGKTALALALAEAWGGEIVNGDAFQVYRGLEILSAAPSAEEKAACPHYLFGIIDAEEPMDAAKYAALANPVIAEIESRRKTAIVVGGSGLYLKFLTHGIAEAPPGDEVIRAELEEWSVEKIFTRLQELDPDEAARQNSQNRRHLSRALEICLVTGGKASELRQNFKDPALVEGLRGIALTWPRDVLAERIALRTRIMLDTGAIEEVKALPPNAGTIRQAIGVREIEAYLKGDMTLAECEERITISTRQYAKRQRNWFRRESWLRAIDGSLPLDQQVEQVTRWDSLQSDHS
ncbi:tRNA (adenosine(37)-N6)-dimethylallyltransferase MiaA [Akkermansiaceae bacterium]|nr:tRNA (adenosine(37)-N6)-dimethylallyltransferase MiaA [Akkermansiaceae bacterium]